MMNKIQILFKDALISKSINVLIIRIFGVLIFFSLTLFLTNFFTSNIVGQYDFSRSLLIIIGSVTVIGMNQSILYYSGYLKAKDSIESIKHIYYKMLLISFLASLLVFITVVFIGKSNINSLYDKDIYKLVVKTTAISFLFSVTMLNIDVLRAIDKLYTSEIFRNVFRYLPFFVFSVIIYSMNITNQLTDMFLLSFVLVGIYSTAYLIVCFSKEHYSKKNSLINIDIIDILKRSYPMAVSSIAFLLMQSIDILLIGKFLSFKEVAYYAVTVKLTMVVSLVLSSVNAVNAPIISNLFSLENLKSLKINLRKVTRLIFGLTLPIILVLIFLSSTVLGLFGSEYILAKWALYILLIGQVVNAYCGSVGVYMNMTGKQGVLQFFLLIALVINIILNWILIPTYGIIGAAVATSVCMVFWNILGALYNYKVDGVKTFLN